MSENEESGGGGRHGRTHTFRVRAKEVGCELAQDAATNCQQPTAMCSPAAASERVCARCASSGRRPSN